jgi:hypothetical protein
MATPGYTPQPIPEEPKKNRTGLIITIVLVVLCCCCLIGGGLGYWLWNNGDQLLGTGALLHSLIAL